MSLTGFTLIELIVAIGVSSLVSLALYFSLMTALNVWQETQGQFLLQQVGIQTSEELSEGPIDTYGLRDSLEIAQAGPQAVSVVMPYSDATQSVYSGISRYTLNKHLKPGSPIPIAEALLPQADEYKVIPITLVDKGKSEEYPEARLNIGLPAGSNLRFTFHPDYKRDTNVLTTFSYDANQQAVFIEDKEGRRDISRNLFGIKIREFLLRYFDNTNTEIDAGSLSEGDISRITGIEIAFKAESNTGQSREIVTFVSLRNAPKHSGNLTLSPGSSFLIPDSKDIQAFFLTNLSGIDNNDTLILQAKPEFGQEWQLQVQFSKPSGQSPPLIQRYTIEYPAGHQVYAEEPRASPELGLNLLSLSQNGLYDYDDDGLQDAVSLKGKVTLEVVRMDIGGASVFVKP